MRAERFSLWVALALLALLVSAAANGGEDEQDGADAPRIEELPAPKFEELNESPEIPLAEVTPAENVCFDARRIRRTRVVDNRNVIVWAPNRRSPHLVRVDGFCFGLRPGLPIAIRSSGSRVCGRAGDEVRTVESRCRIVAVVPIVRGQEDLVEEQVRAETEMQRGGR